LKRAPHPNNLRDDTLINFGVPCPVVSRSVDMPVSVDRRIAARSRGNATAKTTMAGDDDARHCDRQPSY
jgi:hypothetical protein